MYERDEDNYRQEDYDEYEEEASEEEEEEEEVEREEPVSKEQQEFLKLREKLKEKFRQDLKKQTASAFGRQSLFQDKKKTTTNDKFGSFFGPSQPVIASRVIDESRSIRETQHSRVPTLSSSSYKIVKDGGASTSSQQKVVHVHQKKPKFVNEVKKKAQTLKDMRDYSFLLSDDADFPSPTKEELKQPARPSALGQNNSDVQSARAQLKSRPPMPAKPAPNGQVLKNSSALKSMQSHGRAMPPSKGAAPSKPRPVVVEARKSKPGVNGANGSGRPLPSKPAPSKAPHGQATVANQHRVRDNDPSFKKRPSAVPNAAAQRNHFLEQKKPSGGQDSVKAAAKQQLPPSRPSSSKPTKQPLLSSKPSASKSQPLKAKHVPQHDIREERLKKQPMKRRLDDDEDEDAIGMIRKMFGYNPNRYAGVDEDDSDMEADFSTIQMEERRSLKIAQKEDEEQLRLIEEEERRERMRKKQKLSRH